MPQAIPLLIYAYTQSYIAYLAAAFIVNKIIAGKAKSATGSSLAAEAQNRVQVIKSNIEPRKVIYGQAMISGPLVFAAVSGEKDKYLHLVVPLADHEVEEIGDVYFDDRLSTEFDQYNRVLQIAIEYTQAAIVENEITFYATINGNNYSSYQSLSDLGAQIVAREDSIASYSIANNTRTITFSAIDEITQYAISSAHANANIGFGTIIDFDASISTTRSYQSYRIRKHYGSVNQSADSYLVSEVSQWTSDHRLRGVAYIYVRLQYDRDVFPNGIPNVKAVVKGKKVYDPRDGITAYSDNWSLCVRDYLVNEFGLNASSGEVDDDTFIAAANIADESVNTPDGGSQSRYTCNGVINLGNKPLDIAEDLMTGGAGTLVYTQGKYKLYAGAYDSPIGTLTADDLRDRVSVRPTMPRKDLFNGVRGTFVNPDAYWQPGDFPIVKSSEFATQDGGEELLRDIELPFTTNYFAAQRIAQIHLKKSREAIYVEWPAKLTALKFSPWDNVRVILDVMGWSNKEFRIANWELSDDGGINLVLQEESSSSYAYSSGDITTIDQAPNTNLPSAYDLAAPGRPSITEQLYVTQVGSQVKSRAIVIWDSGSEYAYQFQVEYKLITETTWIVAGLTIDTTFRIEDFAPGIYDFRIKSYSLIGVGSDYSATTTYEFLGLTAAPTDVSNFSLAVVGSMVHLSWDQATDLDVLIGGYIRIRHSSKLTGASWNEAVEIGPALAGTDTRVWLPLLAGTYFARFVDSSGNFSENAVSITTTVPNITQFDHITTIQEDPAFSGSKSNIGFITEDSVDYIQLIGSGLWDDIPLIDDVDFIDFYGGVSTEGIYSFANDYDLGGVFTSRLTADVVSETYDTDDFIDSRTDSIDDWLDIDGAIVDDANVQLMVRTTEDDPAVSGGPEWTSWRPFFIGDYKARAFEWRLRFTSANITHNVRVSQLRVTIDMPERTESDNSISVSAGGKTITFANAFRVTPAIGVSIDNLATGDYYTITGKSETSFTIEFFNSTNTSISKTMDWVANGYGYQH